MTGKLAASHRNVLLFQMYISVCRSMFIDTFFSYCTGMLYRSASASGQTGGEGVRSVNCYSVCDEVTETLWVDGFVFIFLTCS